jgi:hypothetical protein
MRTSFTDLFRALLQRWPADEREHHPNPFDTLAIQYRLTSVAAEIHALQRDKRRWARGHHLIAATAAVERLQRAYDAVRDLALTPAESRKFIMRMLEEMPCDPLT